MNRKTKVILIALAVIIIGIITVMCVVGCTTVGDGAVNGHDNVMVGDESQVIEGSDNTIINGDENSVSNTVIKDNKV